MEHANETEVAYERDFKGIWTPAFIWTSSELTPLEKFIVMEIDSLDNGEGCYATNEYLAGICCCSVSKVAHSISKLVEMGYLERMAFNGRKRVIGSRIAKFAGQECKNCKADMQNLQPSYKYVRVLDENTSRDIPPIVPLERTEADGYDPIRDVIDHLNARSGKSFKADTKATRGMVHARMEEGYGVDVIKRVIDLKVGQWSKSPKMRTFIRPSTLFSKTNFENYVNELGPISDYSKYDGVVDEVIGGGL